MINENISPWLYEFNHKRVVKTLSGSLQTDIVVLGGGISGMLTAYTLLKKLNKKVTLIEGNIIAHGATGHNAGYVVADFEKPFSEIVSEYGLHMARSGLQEVEDSLELLKEIYKEINLPAPTELESIITYSNREHFLHDLHQEYLKYGKIKRKVKVLTDSGWQKEIPETLFKYVELIDQNDFRKIIKLKNQSIAGYGGIIVSEILLANSANFTEKLANYLLLNFSGRFEIYENSFINQIRLLDNSQIVLDGLSGLCICDKLVLCTNGFENFKISGPLGREIDGDFHHQVTGLIGYMLGTFTNNDPREEFAGIFYDDNYNHKNIPEDAGPYKYFTNRKFSFGGTTGSLFTLGGPEVKLKNRNIYRHGHFVDKSIYEELKNFQKEYFGITNDSYFKWHGLMGYTKTGIRIVGRDTRFSDLLYNLGCNGIGISTAVSGAFRIAKLLSGEKLERSIFDPR